MPRFGKRVCKTCGKEKLTYLFDGKDEDCVVCAGKNVLRPSKRGFPRNPELYPKPGEFWRYSGAKQTRKQIVDIFKEDGKEYVRYLALEGKHEGKERVIKLRSFIVNHNREDDKNRNKHGWDAWKYTNWYEELKKKGRLP